MRRLKKFEAQVWDKDEEIYFPSTVFADTKTEARKLILEGREDSHIVDLHQTRPAYTKST